MQLAQRALFSQSWPGPVALRFLQGMASGAVSLSLLPRMVVGLGRGRNTASLRGQLEFSGPRGGTGVQS